MYSAGDFSFPTNLFFWIVQAWYGLLFVGGLLTGAWRSAAQFKDLIASEAAIVLLWGRLLGVAASAAGVFILTRMVAPTVDSRSVRLLVYALLVLNPIDLVSSAWLKFDGTAYFVNAILVAALVAYLQDHDLRARRRLYVLAIAACSFRIDLAAFLVITVGYDLIDRQPFAPVRRAIAAGVLAYAVVTLIPMVVIYRAIGRGPGVHTVSGSNLLGVSNTFEQNITKYFLDNLSIRAIAQAVGTNLAFYARLACTLGLVVILPFWPRLARVRQARVCLVVAATLLAPLLFFPANGTRYFLLFSVQLILAAGWGVSITRRPLRLAIAAATLALVGSVTVEALLALRTGTDARIAAGRYLLDATQPRDLIAVKGYVNPGHHPVFEECADDLLLKAQVIREHGLGTGETLRLKAARPVADCRHVLEVTERDRFKGTPYAGRWINAFDARALDGMQPPPRLFASDVPMDAGADGVPPSFAAFIARRYTLVRTFEPHFADVRLHWLLDGTPYYVKLYIYRLNV